MANAYFRPPLVINEPVLDYAPDSSERSKLQEQIKAYRGKEIDVPMFIGGKEVFTDEKVSMHPPHDLKHTLGHYSKGNQKHVKEAIDAALSAKKDWENMPWQERASIFLKAADLIAGPYRDKLNAATMLGQSKNVYQAEIDAVCELVDFLRFNVQFMSEIYEDQPISEDGMWNRIEHRPLEGFIFALTPFNFTAIAGNLPSAPAMLGNTVVWKPAMSQIYSAQLIMRIFQEAGLPDGVINLIYTDGPDTGEVVFKHRDFGGLHFTGGTSTFEYLWKTIGENIGTYKSYPRIVGETGGKDYVMVHPTANPKQIITALARGAFEFQGQKCSAASRAYIPKSHWKEVRAGLERDLSSFKMGGSEDFSNFITAVIDRKSYDKITGYIDAVKESDDAEIIIGGDYDDSKGYFVSPTVVLASNPHSLTMEEEIFGPVLTIYVYEDNDFEKTLDILDATSPYALTGSIFAKGRDVIAKATERLRHTAGNFYINDKPTGSVVGQQPFGGARKSGTNDKAGSKLNLLRWVSQRTIKETFNAPTDYRYPFLGEE
jgi:1-pyrroline-5-carboxylate dehydrogenase